MLNWWFNHYSVWWGCKHLCTKSNVNILREAEINKGNCHCILGNHFSVKRPFVEWPFLTPTSHYVFVCKALYVLFYGINDKIARQFHSCTRKTTGVQATLIFYASRTGCASTYQNVGYLVGDHCTLQANMY